MTWVHLLVPTSHTEEMDVDYGPALPPRLRSDLHNASDQNSNASEEPSKKVSDRPKNTLTLTVGMRLNRGLPRINTIMNPINLGCHLQNPQNMLIRVDIRSGPDTCHDLPQRRISPLQPDTGLQSPLGLSLTKTNLNMIQTPLIIGK